MFLTGFTSFSVLLFFLYQSPHLLHLCAQFLMLLMLMIVLLFIQTDQASDLWEQLELASELESDLQDTVDWGKKWLVDFNAGKTQLVLFDRSNNNCSIDVKMNGSVLQEKSSFKKLGLTFSSKLGWGFYIISIAKTASKKIGAFICPMKSLSPEVALSLYNYTTRPVWNTVATF